MKTSTIACFLFFGVIAAACGQSFYLQDDETGKKSGPYALRDGGKIKLMGREFTVVKSKHVEPSIRQKLQGTIIPEIKLRHARITDVIDFLRTSSMEHSPFKDAKHPGVNFIMKLKPAELRMVSPITFTARNLSLEEAMESIFSVSFLDYEVTSSWVMVKGIKKR